MTAYLIRMTRTGGAPVFHEDKGHDGGAWLYRPEDATRYPHTGIARNAAAELRRRPSRKPGDVIELVEEIEIQGELAHRALTDDEAAT